VDVEGEVDFEGDDDDDDDEGEDRTAGRSATPCRPSAVIRVANLRDAARRDGSRVGKHRGAVHGWPPRLRLS
jgi:hypothetical protein